MTTMASIAMGVPIAHIVADEWDIVGYTINGDVVYTLLSCDMCTLYVNGKVFDPLADFEYIYNPDLDEYENEELREELQEKHWDSQIF